MSTATDTRRIAYHRSHQAAVTIKARILDAIQAAGPHGLTDHELSTMLKLLSDSSRSQRVALRREGLVADSGRRRPSPRGLPSIVWIATNPQVLATDPIRRAPPAEMPQSDHGPGVRPAVAVRRVREGRCSWCGSRDFHHLPNGVQLCANCYPPPKPSPRNDL